MCQMNSPGGAGERFTGSKEECLVREPARFPTSDGPISVKRVHVRRRRPHKVVKAIHGSGHSDV